VVGAIFRKGESPRDINKPSGEKRGRREHPNRHRRNHRPTCTEEGVVTAADRPRRLPTKNGNDHFQKLMDSPCQNNGFPVRPKLQEGEILKHFISKLLAKKAKQEEPSKLVEQETPTEDFPKTMGCLKILGGEKHTVIDVAIGRPDEKCSHRSPSSHDTFAGRNSRSYSTSTAIST
jgi:hypothetical protein